MPTVPLATQRKAIHLRETERLGRKTVAERLGITEKQTRLIFEKHDGIPTGIITPHRVYVWDLETTDFSSFIGSLGVAAFLDTSTGKIKVRNWHDYEGTIQQREHQLAQWAAERYTEADILTGHNSLGFDTAFLRGTLTRCGLPDLPPRDHRDTMLIAQHGLKGRIGGYSMDNLADYFNLPIRKDRPSKHDWRLYMAGDPDACERITTRCIEDVKVNALLWGRLRPFYYKWRGK